MKITTISDEPLYPRDESFCKPGDYVYIDDMKKTLGAPVGGGWDGIVFEIVEDKNKLIKCSYW